MSTLDRSIFIPAGAPIADTNNVRDQLDNRVPGGTWRLRPGALAKSISVAQPPPRVGESSFSIVAWVTVAGGHQYWLDSRRHDPEQTYPVGPGWLMGAHLDRRGGSDVRLLFQMNAAASYRNPDGRSTGTWSNFWNGSGPAPLESGKTYCFVAAVDATNFQVKLYVNELLEHDVADGNELSGADVSGSALMIGNGRDVYQRAGVDHFAGELHGFGIYDRVLSDDEARTLTDLMTSAVDEWSAAANPNRRQAVSTRPSSVLTFETQLRHTLIVGSDSQSLIEAATKMPVMASANHTVLVWLAENSQTMRGTLLDYGEALQLVAADGELTARPYREASSGLTGSLPTGEVSLVVTRCRQDGDQGNELALFANDQQIATTRLTTALPPISNVPLQIGDSRHRNDPSTPVVVAVLIVDGALDTTTISSLASEKASPDPSTWTAWGADLATAVGELLTTVRIDEVQPDAPV